jgi:flagellar M-ring protein FliF
VRRIVDIIGPIVGEDAIRAQVAADVDFSRVERTTETYDPESGVVRSEQISEDESRATGMSGVPGALTNQPPEAGFIGGAQVADAPEDAENPLRPTPPTSASRRAVRNFEIDRTVSHIREAPGGLRRLSVAVVVDFRNAVNAEGAVERTPLDEEEMARITSLVREAVGFDENRGDRVNVINASFRPLTTPEPLPEPPVWQEPWVVDLAKTILAVIVVLFLALTVLRPVLRSLADRGSEARSMGDAGRGALPEGGGGEMRQGLPHEARMALTGPQDPGRSHEVKLETARGLVRDDPRRVAQLMKNWIASDGTAG